NRKHLTRLRIHRKNHRTQKSLLLSKNLQQRRVMASERHGYDDRKASGGKTEKRTVRLDPLRISVSCNLRFFHICYRTLDHGESAVVFISSKNFFEMNEEALDTNVSGLFLFCEW